MLWAETEKFQVALSEKYLDHVSQCRPDDEKFDSILLSTLSTGWTAQYEVYRIGEDDTREYAIDIPLSKEEIATQVRQSLRRSPLGVWKLNFPMAISADLTVLVILRSVIVLKIDRSGCEIHRVRASPPLVLQIDYRDSAAFNWSDRRPFFALPYLYSTAVSCDNKFLIFKDHDMGFKEANNRSIALFRLELGFGSHEARPVSHFEYREAEGGGDLWVLHHYRPRLIFIAFRAVYLWELQDCRLSNQDSRLKLR